jgi:hypothetical protein
MNPQNIGCIISLRLVRLVFLLSLGFSPASFSQVVTGISPTVAEAGIEAQFEVTGAGLPLTDKPGQGLKLATFPDGACQHARRYRVATATKYYFSCIFSKNLGKVTIHILNVNGRLTHRLASFPIGLKVNIPTPNLGLVVFSGSSIGAEEQTINCHQPICVVQINRPTESDQIWVELFGENLPHDVQIDGYESCARASSQTIPHENLKNLAFKCTNSKSTQAIQFRSTSTPAFKYVIPIIQIKS